MSWLQLSQVRLDSRLWMGFQSAVFLSPMVTQSMTSSWWVTGAYTHSDALLTSVPLSSQGPNKATWSSSKLREGSHTICQEAMAGGHGATQWRTDDASCYRLHTLLILPPCRPAFLFFLPMTLECKPHRGRIFVCSLRGSISIMQVLCFIHCYLLY